MPTLEETAQEADRHQQPLIDKYEKINTKPCLISTIFCSKSGVGKDLNKPFECT